MKKRLLLLLAITAMLCSCDPIWVLQDKEYSFFIFRYADETNKELIITTVLSHDSTGQAIKGICDFPKRYKNEPYYSGEKWAQEPEKYHFDICELATEEKLLTLHDGYYTYFPYTNINRASEDVIRNGKWENICDSNPTELPILGDASSLYQEIRSFEIRSLEKITGKSRKEMTIDDIEKAINILIDKGQLDTYSVKVSNMWRSKY